MLSRWFKNEKLGCFHIRSPQKSVLAERKGTWPRTLHLFSDKWDTFKTIVIKKNIGYKWTKNVVSVKLRLRLNDFCATPWVRYNHTNTMVPDWAPLYLMSMRGVHLSLLAFRTDQNAVTEHMELVFLLWGCALIKTVAQGKRTICYKWCCVIFAVSVYILHRIQSSRKKGALNINQNERNGYVTS